MNILHNWQLNLYTLKLEKIFVCQDPVLRQIAAGVRAQRFTSMATGERSCRQHIESEVDMEEAKQMAVLYYRIKVGPNRDLTDRC